MSAFPSNAVPMLAPGGRASGSAMVPKAQGTMQLENLASNLFLASLGNNAYKLAPLISTSARTWGDIDLFTVHASNAMMLTDVLQYKLNTTTGASVLTGVLAPKVAVPSNTNTFKGRAYQYNVIPATNVPKRGTVRSMTKTLREWQTNMKQSGIGSQLEGGAYRSPEGRTFLEQEMTAFGLSFEMHICLSTAETAVLAAVTKPFRDTGRSSTDEITLGKQIARELQTFCCGGGDSNYFTTVISDTLQTIPAASIILMPLSLTQTLRFNDKAAPRAFENQSVSLIETNGKQEYALVKNGTTASLYTIFGGKLAVMEMPTFAFQENQPAYQALQHELVATEYIILGADKGLKPWYDVQVPTILGNGDYHSANLAQHLYDHNQDSRTKVEFSTALQTAFIFKIAGAVNKYHVTQVDRAGAYDSVTDSLVADMTTLVNAQTVTYGLNVRDVKTVLDRYAATTGIGDYLEEVPVNYNNRNKTKGQKVYTDLIEDIQQMKRNVQFPLTSRLKMDKIYARDNNKNLYFCLPNCIGDLDPAHLSSNFMKCMVGDLHTCLSSILMSKEMSQYFSLRSELLELPYDPSFFEAVIAENNHMNVTSDFSSKAIGNKLAAKALFSNYVTMANGNTPITTVGAYFPSTSYPVNPETDLINIPDEKMYKKFYDKDRPTTSSIGIQREKIPMGLWSARGLRYLARSSSIGSSNLSKTADNVYVILATLWNQLTGILPYTIYSNMTKIEHLALFLSLGAPNVLDDLQLGLPEVDGVQLLMNMLDVDMDLYHVALNTKSTSDLKLFNLMYSNPDEAPYFMNDSDLVEEKIKNNSIVINVANMGTFEIKTQVPPGNINLLKIYDVVSKTPLTEEDYFTKVCEYVANWKDEHAFRSSKLNKLTDNEKYFVACVVGPLVSIISDIRTFFMTSTIPTTIRTFPFEFNATDHTVKRVPISSSSERSGIYEQLTAFLNSNSNLKGTDDARKTVFTFNMDNTVNVSGSLIFKSTGLVLSFKQLPKNDGKIDFGKLGKHVRLFTRFGVNAANVQSDLQGANRTTSGNYRYHLNQFQKYGRENHIFENMKASTLTNKVCHTYWFEGRFAKFVDSDPAKPFDNSWSTTARMLSAFLLHTQFHYYAIEKAIQCEIRPLFDIACFRSPCFIMNGILLAVPGLSTMFNPYTNAHVGCARDANTDQYNIRTVIETATVVINPQNLAFVPAVQPVAYCGGRNNRFISNPAEVPARSETSVNMASLKACIVSHGYMCTAEEPISFINKPPCTITNGVPDEAKETQKWPGAYFYGKIVYAKWFGTVQNMPAAQASFDEQQQRAFAEWLSSNMSSGHTAFKATSYAYDSSTGSYSYRIPGTGHLKQNGMNSTGAKDYFEGKTSTLITEKYQMPTNYN